MFTIVDGVVAVILLGSAGMAFLRGFVHEVLAIAAWAGAGLAALYGYPHFQPWVQSQVGVPWAADALTGVGLFLVALLVLSLVTKSVSNRVRKSALNSVDSSLGFVFGLLRGAVVVCLAYMLGVWAIEPEAPPPWLANAKTKPWLERGATMIEKLRPEGLGRDDKKPNGPTATGDLEEDSRRAETFRELAAPQPAAPPPKDGKPARQGYGKDETSEMNRLILQTNK